MLSESPSYHYIHEPFNPTVKVPGYTKLNVRYWFEHVHDGNAHRLADDLQRLVDGRYSLLPEQLPISPRTLRRTIRQWKEHRRRQRAGSKPLLKDPVAVFAAEWIAQRFNASIVVSIRHPAAFVSSIKRLGWRIDHAKEFLQQSSLMERYLHPFEADISSSSLKDPIIDQAALTWRLIYHVVRCYQDEHPEWHFVHHEALSLDPDREFGLLAERLAIDYEPAVRNAVLDATSPENPSEIALTTGSGGINTTQSVKADSRANATAWHRRLTAGEIARIRSLVEDVSEHFYDDASWVM